jgi:hypothetical protein
MAGLDMVKGPHWSQILTLFGQNGTISDILKDRTQVQLKDKARNLKLFFLKTNSEMPYYLQCVTGELKTRAPSQAARKEAEEKARLNSEEEQARIQGIFTLAGGLQNTPRNIGSPATTSMRPSPITPAVRPQGAGVGAPAVTNATSANPLIKNETLDKPKPEPQVLPKAQFPAQPTPQGPPKAIPGASVQSQAQVQAPPRPLPQPSQPPRAQPAINPASATREASDTTGNAAIASAEAREEKKLIQALQAGMATPSG